MRACPCFTWPTHLEWARRNNNQADAPLPSSGEVSAVFPFRLRFYQSRQHQRPHGEADEARQHDLEKKRRSPESAHETLASQQAERRAVAKKKTSRAGN